MKLTWFGGTTLRIHIGGAILVVDAEGAPAGIDRAELVSGADRLVRFDADLPKADGERWKPRPALRPLDETGEMPEVSIFRLGDGALVVDALGESPLLLLAGEPPGLGRWAENAVVVLAGGELGARGEAVLALRHPRLLALAGEDAAVDEAVARLRDRLDGTGLMALHAGMAVEA